MISSFSFRFAVSVVTVSLLVPAAAAQQVDQIGGGDAAAAAQTGGGTATDGAAGAAFPGMDAETAFENVERGSTVGATGETGAGFSDLSVGGAGVGAGGGGLGGLGGFGGGFGGLGGLGNLFGGLGGSAAQSTKPVIRTRIRSAVAVAPVPPAQIQQRANLRLRSVATRPQLRGINVTMQGRTAVLRGVVASDRDRRMSEMLIRLEPGVRGVDNQVTVRQ